MRHRAKWLSVLELPKTVVRLVLEWKESASVIVSLEKSDEELRFHPLFAETLGRIQITKCSSQNRLGAQMVVLCLEAHREIDALELCRRNQDWERYWKILELSGPRLIKRGQTARLEHVLKSLPEGILHRFEGPVLSTLFAAAHLREAPERSYRLGVKALGQIVDHSRHLEIWALALSITANATVAAGLSLDHFRPLLIELETHIHQPRFSNLDPESRIHAIWAGTVALILGVKAFPIKRLNEHIEQVIEDCDNIDLQAATASAAMRLFVVHGLSHFVESAHRQVAKLKIRAQTPSSTLALLHATTNHYLARGEKAQAILHANRSLRLFCDETSFIWKIEQMTSSAFCATSIEDLDQLRTNYEQLAAISSSLGREVSAANLYKSTYQGCLAAHNQEHTQAMQHFLRAVRISDRFVYPLKQIVARTRVMLTSLQLGDIEGAETAIAQSVEILSTCDIPLADRSLAGMQAVLSIHRAQAPSSQDKSTEALAKARQRVQALMELMKESDSFLLSTDMLPLGRSIYVFALDQKIQPELVQRMVRRTPLYPSPRPHRD